jgi:dienelactone hydrolase
MNPLRLCLSLILLLACVTAQAALREEEVDLPVSLTNAYGKRIDHAIKLTLFSDDTNPRPAPVMLINHGRAGTSQERTALGRARYFEISRTMVQRGFIVAVPTRVGYGVTGGEDIEDGEACDRKNYPAGFAAAANQTLAVLDMARRRPDASPDRAVVMGQSYGGATSVAVAALNPSGVVAAINFAGGSGGNPIGRPQRPCSPQQLERTYRTYGQFARVPMLWIYTENDMYFGPSYPREWFAAYVANGAPAEFVQFPPHGEDGHRLFTQYPDVWLPRVTQFLEARGFKAPIKGKSNGTAAN